MMLFIQPSNNFWICNCFNKIERLWRVSKSYVKKLSYTVEENRINFPAEGKVPEWTQPMLNIKDSIEECHLKTRVQRRLGFVSSAAQKQLLTRTDVVIKQWCEREIKDGCGIAF